MIPTHIIAGIAGESPYDKLSEKHVSKKDAILGDFSESLIDHSVERAMMVVNSHFTDLLINSSKDFPPKFPDKTIPRELFFQIVGVLARYDGYIILTKADGMNWAGRLMAESKDAQENRP